MSGEDHGAALCACGKPATCWGSYEGHGKPEFACDDCCGHGNEDGWCVPATVAAIADHAEVLIGDLERAEAERDKALELVDEMVAQCERAAGLMDAIIADEGAAGTSAGTSEEGERETPGQRG